MTSIATLYRRNNVTDMQPLFEEAEELFGVNPMEHNKQAHRHYDLSFINSPEHWKYRAGLSIVAARKARFVKDYESARGHLLDAQANRLNAIECAYPAKRTFAYYGTVAMTSNHHNLKGKY